MLALDWPPGVGVGWVGHWGESRGKENSHLGFLPWMKVAEFQLLPNLAPSLITSVDKMPYHFPQGFKKSVGKGFRTPIKRCF